MASLVALMACNKDTEQDWSGFEYFDFTVSGVVTDVSDNPIEGICVSSSGMEVLTTSEGEYTLRAQGTGRTTISISFSDNDGAENGGKFFGVSQSIDLDYVKGAHGPYLGIFNKSGVNVKLQLVPTILPNTDIPLQY